jgi:hypothetical protein
MVPKTYWIIIGRLWLAARPPSMPLLYSERYGGRHGLRFLGWRFHARWMKRNTQ